MGDIIQCFPAITLLKETKPNCEIHWLCDEEFSEIPQLHPAVKKVHTLAIRKFKKQKKTIFQTWKQIKSECQKLNAEKFTDIIDLQSLIKSSVLLPFIKGNSHGHNRKSCIEPLASLFYKKKYYINYPPKNTNLSHRSTKLIEKIYNLEKINKASYPNFGLITQTIKRNKKEVILHFGTTWITKHWPDKHWAEIIKYLNDERWNIHLSWYGERELNRCKKFQKNYPKCNLLHKKNHPNIASSIKDKIENIKNCSLMISVDTGIAHLANALKTPCMILYGPSTFLYSAALGQYTKTIKSPQACHKNCKKNKCYLNLNSALCMKKISPESIINEIKKLKFNTQ